MNLHLFQSYICRSCVKFPTRKRSKFVQVACRKIEPQQLHGLAHLADINPRGSRIEAKVEPLSLDGSHSFLVAATFDRGEYRYTVQFLEYESAKHSKQATAKLAWDFNGIRQKLHGLGFDSTSLDAFQQDLVLRVYQNRIVVVAQGPQKRCQAESKESVEQSLKEELAAHLEKYAELTGSLEERREELAQTAKNEFAAWVEDNLRNSFQGILKHLPHELFRNEPNRKNERKEFCFVHFVHRVRLMLQQVLVPAYSAFVENAGLQDREKEEFHQQLQRVLDALETGSFEPGQALETLGVLKTKAADHDFLEGCKVEVRSTPVIERLCSLHKALIEHLAQTRQRAEAAGADGAGQTDSPRHWWSQPYQPGLRSFYSEMFTNLKEFLQADIQEKYRVMDCQGKPLLTKNTELRDKYYLEKCNFGILIYSEDQDWENKQVKIDWFPLAAPADLRSEVVQGALIRNSVQQERDAVYVMIECSTAEPGLAEQEYEYILYLIDESLLQRSGPDPQKIFSQVVWSKKCMQTRQEIQLLLTSVSDETLAVVQNSGVIDLVNRNLDYPIHLKVDIKDLRAAAPADCLQEFDLLQKMRETAPEAAGYRGSFVYRSFMHRKQLILLCSDAFDSELNQKVNRILTFKVKREALVFRSQYLLPKVKKDEWYYPVYLAKCRYAAVMVVVSGTKGYRLVSIWRDKFQCVGKNELPLDFRVPEGCRGFEKSGHVRSEWIEKGRRINVILTEPKDFIHNPDCFLMELQLKM